MSDVLKWFQNLADKMEHSRFLDRQMSTGIFGVPIATFGLVTIVAAIFVHVTFADELQSAGSQVYAVAQETYNRASQVMESAQDTISEQTNRLSESLASAEEEVEEVTEKVGEKAAEVRDKVGEVSESLENKFQEQFGAKDGGKGQSLRRRRRSRRNVSNRKKQC